MLLQNYTQTGEAADRNCPDTLGQWAPGWGGGRCRKGCRGLVAGGVEMVGGWGRGGVGGGEIGTTECDLKTLGGGVACVGGVGNNNNRLFMVPIS